MRGAARGVFQSITWAITSLGRPIIQHRDGIGEKMNKLHYINSLYSHIGPYLTPEKHWVISSASSTPAAATAAAAARGHHHGGRFRVG